MTWERNAVTATSLQCSQINIYYRNYDHLPRLQKINNDLQELRELSTESEAVNKPVYCNNNICLRIKLLNILTQKDHQEVKEC